MMITKIPLFLFMFQWTLVNSILPFLWKRIVPSLLLTASIQHATIDTLPIQHNNLVTLESTNTHTSDIRVSNNNVFFYGPITSESCRELSDVLITLDNNSETFSINFGISPPPINLHLQTEGGSLMNTFYIIDLVDHLKTPVHTYVDGYVASAGSLISVVGKKRYMTKNSFIMIHQLSSSLGEGKFNDLDDNMDNLNKFMDTIRNIYLSKTNMPLNQLNDILDHDLWMNSKECLEHGLVDEII